MSVMYNVTLQIKITDGLPCLLEVAVGSLAGVYVLKNLCRPVNLGGKWYYICESNIFAALQFSNYNVVLSHILSKSKCGYCTLPRYNLDDILINSAGLYF